MDPNTPTGHRIRLNNLLQANGGVGRLRWGEPIKDGPDDRPSWTVEAFLDGVPFGRATRGTVAAAKEEVARQVLGYLTGDIVH